MYLSLKENNFLYKNEKNPFIISFKKDVPFDLKKKMKVNKSGAYILGKCNGKNTKEDIINSIVKDFDISEKRARKDTERFLDEKEDWIKYSEKQKDVEDRIIGNFRGYHPYRAYIQLTYECNMGCEYCYLPEERDVVLEDVEKTMGFLYDWGIRRVIITGGEPLIRDDIISILRYASKKFVGVTVQTNGSLITDKLEELTTLPENTLYLVSLDGPKEHINNNYKGLYYDDIVEGIERLINNDNYVNLTATISKENIEYVDWLKEDGQDFVETRINFGMVQPIGDDLKYYRDLYNDDEFIEKYEEKIGEDYFDEIIKDGNIDNPRCPGGVEAVTIKPDGDIIPCPSLLKSDRYIMGNVYRDDLNDISKGIMKQYAERRKMNREDCSNCEYYDFCEGGYCLVMAEYLCENEEINPNSFLN